MEAIVRRLTCWRACDYFVRDIPLKYQILSRHENKNMILDLFLSRPAHPLCDTKERKRVLGALLAGDAFKVVEEIYGWFESLRRADGLSAEQLFDIVSQLDETGYHKVRRLTRDYLYSSRLSKSEERRLWSMCFNYWGELAGLYAHCAELIGRGPKDKATEPLKSIRPLLLSRQMAAGANQLRWMLYGYSVIGEDLWRSVGKAFARAVAVGEAQEPVRLYPGIEKSTSVTEQYLHLLVLSASSTDSLMPSEIDLADRLIDHLLPHFVFSETFHKDSVYWIDFAEGRPPTRLAREPAALVPTLRFFSPGSSYQELNALIQAVEQGEIPESLLLGGNYSANAVLRVLRHLALYWAPKPPLRVHQRHSVKARIAVLQGFDDSFILFSGEVARFGKEREAAVWVVENVSLSGFLASAEINGGGLSVGTLLGLQPEGGENWVLGMVRRYNRENETQASVGIQTLSRQAWSVKLHPQGNGFSVRGAIPGICLSEGVSEGEIQIVMPLASFDARAGMQLVHENRRYSLSPIKLEETGMDFEIARYRVVPD